MRGAEDRRSANAAFENELRLEDDLFMIVECKKKTRKDGVAQLKLYLDMSPAQVGVWFNGDAHVYLRKIHHKDGRRTLRRDPKYSAERAAHRGHRSLPAKGPKSGLPT
jgi:hypothetical protein